MPCKAACPCGDSKKEGTLVLWEEEEELALVMVEGVWGGRTKVVGIRSNNGSFGGRMVLSLLLLLPVVVAL